MRIVLALALFASAAMAQDKPQQAAPAANKPVSSFSVRDTDKNGVVSHPERQQFRKEKFAANDTDKDGKLSKDELGAAWGQVFKRVDVSADGFVEVDEYVGYFCGEAANVEQSTAAKSVPVKQHDANGDGNITQEECVAYRALVFKDVTLKDGKAGEKEFVSAHVRVIFEAMDKNGDGFISEEEFTLVPNPATGEPEAKKAEVKEPAKKAEQAPKSK